MVVAGLVLFYGIKRDNFAIAIIGGSILIFIGLIILGNGLSYSLGTTTVEWSENMTIGGNVQLVTLTNTTDIQTSFTGGMANAFGLIIMLFGIAVIFISATEQIRGA